MWTKERPRSSSDTRCLPFSAEGGGYWVIDLGPEGGDGGGTIVAEGTPEQVAKAKGSYTGRFLAPLLPKAATRAARQSGGRGANAKVS
jgi:hypothetical protein